MNEQLITAHTLPLSERAAFVSKLFDIRFLWIEAFVFDTAASLSEQYDGGCWGYVQLSNGGFYMAPTASNPFQVDCANGFAGEMSGDAFGLTACLYAFSLLSFSPDEEFAQCCADHFHLLRAFALAHSEAPAILAATD